MSATFIATTPRADYNALKHQGILVAECYRQISSTLEKNLSAEHAAIFAQPFHTAGGDDTDWYSQAQGPVSPLGQLPADYQRNIYDRLAGLMADIRALAERLINSPASATRGHILKLALHYPSADNLYLVGSQPVITCWGFVPASAGVLPQDITRRAPLAAADSSATLPAARASGAGGHEKQAALFIWPAWLSRLLWLLLALATTLLVLTVLNLFTPGGNFGCATAPPGREQTPAVLPQNQALPPDDAISLAEEVERGYRQRLEDLRRQLIARAAQCQQAAPPEQQPDIESSLPRTEQPEIKPPTGLEEQNRPPLKPEDKPEARPEEKPRATPETQAIPEIQAKPETQAIPESGAPLQIPGEAAQEKDLAFLEGCWINTSQLYNMETKQSVTARYCFDKNGNGSRVVIEPDGTRCAGSARARFDSSGKLIILSDSAACNRGDSGYVPQRIECRGSDTSTSCSGREQTPQAHEWNANFRRQ